MPVHKVLFEQKLGQKRHFTADFPSGLINPLFWRIFEVPGIMRNNNLNKNKCGPSFVVFQDFIKLNLF